MGRGLLLQCMLYICFNQFSLGDKIPMEDLCQLSERQTEYKYKSSYEQVAKVIRKFSSVPEMDLTRYYELLIFCWLTGNNDMHLKNFALYNPTGDEFRLTPAYDLLNAVIVNPRDIEELALTLNAKKRKIKKEDFVQAMQKSGISDKVIDNIFRRVIKKFAEWQPIIQQSFLPPEFQEAYWELVKERLGRLQIV